MLATMMVVGALLQASTLPPATWKERNQPDSPTLPPCDLGKGARQVDSLAALPAQVREALIQAFRADAGMADVGGRFNRTDFVSDESVPRRRFIRAYQADGYWIIWYERGGQVYGHRIVALHQRQARRAATPDWQLVTNSFLSGNLCEASKAILVGVRSGLPA